MSEDRKVKLKSCDDIIIEVDVRVASESKTLKGMIELDIEIDREIVLPNFSGKILAMVMLYCRYHVELQKNSDENQVVPQGGIEEWDEQFVRIDESTLFDLILAANYLDIPNLLDWACLKVADMIKDKTLEEMRETLNIQNDFTAEEEEVMRENQWFTPMSDFRLNYTREEVRRVNLWTSSIDFVWTAVSILLDVFLAWPWRVGLALKSKLNMILLARRS